MNHCIKTRKIIIKKLKIDDFSLENQKTEWKPVGSYCMCITPFKTQPFCFVRAEKGTLDEYFKQNHIEA